MRSQRVEDLPDDAILLVVVQRLVSRYARWNADR